MIHWPTIRALTLDCYGTLVDWEAGIIRDLKAGLVSRSGKSAADFFKDEEWLRFFAQAEPAAEAEAPPPLAAGDLHNHNAGPRRRRQDTVRAPLAHVNVYFWATSGEGP